MYQRFKDQRAWQLEQGRELSALKTKVDGIQEVGITNRTLDNQTAMGLSSLDGRVEVLERKGAFLLDRQEQDNNAWTNVSYGLRTEIDEVKKESNRRIDLQEQARRRLHAEFIEGRQELEDALQIARRERKERLRMKTELDELKEDFAKLKGMVRLAVAAQNLNNNGFPTEDIQDVFNPRLVEESSSDEEVPEENLVPIPVPGPSFEVLETLREIPPSPTLSMRAFLSQPVVIASSVPLLGSSPQLLRLLVEDSSVGVGATVEEFEAAVEHEAEVIAMVDALVESEEEPLTNDPEAVEELNEVWDAVMDTSPVEGDPVGRYAGGGFI